MCSLTPRQATLLSSIRRRYIVALSTIAVLVTTGHAVAYWIAQTQRIDGHVINVAGRQRMASQRIAKAASALSIAIAEDDPARLEQAREELRSTTALLTNAHDALLNGSETHALPPARSEATRALLTGLSGAVDAIGEGLVEAQPVRRPPLGLAQASADMEVLRQQHQARRGAPPQDGPPFAVPGEDPLRIGVHDSLGGQVAAHREQPVFGRFAGLWEPQRLRQGIDGHGGWGV